MQFQAEGTELVSRPVEKTFALNTLKEFFDDVRLREGSVVKDDYCGFRKKKKIVSFIPLMLNRIKLITVIKLPIP